MLDTGLRRDWQLAITEQLMCFKFLTSPETEWRDSRVCSGSTCLLLGPNYLDVIRGSTNE
jgi:hypothetical protein